MSLDKATVARIAALARIRVAEEDLDGLARELSNIMGWIEQLNAVDTEGVPPMSRAADQKLRWREDKVTDGGIPEKVLANAPAAKDGFFTVPKVIE
ncbi:MAG: Asp-tRNA(Asn)/Glu-tRNA(Gln) amidotransferase subunit GatC [Alphaproteobacteria bacterium]|nr:Asp-tRNA(Asn)/Glu-tRNA(Gln) amidotransferase subunit GatC [Alphaproteobacteria bacterium]MCZ6608671.1 Asp-tRNA(Asn)/Glu-tRNA(Gln) amidotransferase subunit GatC [Alphaproteobacteria bacterium]MCZ6742653.1 Asp-tRNA(Asn)/Glu-tRNA(Gln) amidotransferase subunit GatC [Alphaproteobacteria bacterium]MCZ6847736.1 Asp-tRNA(Asn)/Glu-tRNA(Gln) amidotransferase subunit GatC [Alphaproteobacteria bacterium]